MYDFFFSFFACEKIYKMYTMKKKKVCIHINAYKTCYIPSSHSLSLHTILGEASATPLPDITYIYATNICIYIYNSFHFPFFFCIIYIYFYSNKLNFCMFLILDCGDLVSCFCVSMLCLLIIWIFQHFFFYITSVFSDIYRYQFNKYVWHFSHAKQYY